MIVRMVVQLPLTGPWGTDDEVVARNDLATALDERFRESGFGRLRGTEDGAGKTSIILSLTDDDWDTGPLELVLSELRPRGLIDKAVVATCAKWKRTDEDRYEVEWPADYDKPFSLD
jgi:hypothetical protein